MRGRGEGEGGREDVEKRRNAGGAQGAEEQGKRT